MSDEGRREVPRDGVLKSAKIQVGASVMNCVVLDVSEHGARVRLEAMVLLPPQATLYFRGGAAFLVERRWARAQEVGFAFIGPAALTARKAAEAEAVLHALRASGFDRLLAGLRQERHFDDPALAYVAQEAAAAVARLGDTLARLSRPESTQPPDVFA